MSNTTRSEFYPTRKTRGELSGKSWEMSPSALPASTQSEIERPSAYVADDGLVHAFNVSLLLGQPLLLTGEPGTGKTQFAFSAQHWLGFERLIRFNTKSTTQARDFFYQVDEVRRFRDAQRRPADGASQGDSDGRSLALQQYMKLGPLGEAIMRANPPGTYPALPQPDNHTQQGRSIVLIDEIDKAARDVPNDLLNEFENMEFGVPELNLTVRAQKEARPVLIITSNSERNLPDAFLRRCVFYNIPFPGEDPSIREHDRLSVQRTALREIVQARLPRVRADLPFVDEALEIFGRLRERKYGVQKRPGTAELLSWLVILHRQGDLREGARLREKPELFQATLSILMKNRADTDIARRIFDNYTTEKR